MATKRGDVDPTQRILQIEADLGDLRAQLRSAKGPRENTLRGKIANLEQELIEVKKAEIKLGREAYKDGERAKRELNKAQQNRASAYNKQARQVEKSTREQAKQDRAEAAGASSGGGFGPSGRVMRRGKVTRAGRGAVAGAAMQGYEQEGLTGAGKNIGATLVGIGLTGAATGAGAIPGLITAGVGALIWGASKLTELGKDQAKRQLAIARSLSEMSSLRFRQFGASTLLTGPGGRQGIRRALTDEDYEKKYTEEMTALADVQREAIATGIRYGFDPQDIEQLKASMATIGAVTGESYQRGIGKFFAEDGIVRQIGRMHAEGMGSIEDLTNKYAIAVRQYGMGPERALQSIRSVAQEARAISLENIAEAGEAASQKNVVLMEDFVSAVEEARSEVDSLVATEEGLAKAMRVGLRLANDTTMSYMQKLKGAKELVRGMTSQQSAGFAVANAARKTDYLIKMYKEKLNTATTEEEKSAAKAKLEDLEVIKNVPPDFAAKFLTQAGFDEDLVGFNLSEAVGYGRYKSVHMMQAMQQNELGLEQTKLMIKLGKEMEKGVSKEEVLKKLMTGGEEGKKAKIESEKTLLGRQEAMRKVKQGLQDKETLDFYKDQAKDYEIARKGGVQDLIKNYTDVVNAVTDLIQNTLMTRFSDLGTSVANATRAIEQSYKSLPVPVPTKSVPFPSSGAANNGATVDAAGNVMIFLPAGALREAIGVANARSTATGVTP